MLFVFMIFLKKIIKKLNNINITYSIYDSMLMISKDLLLIAGDNKLSIINVNTYNLIKIIKSDNSSWINSVIMLNKNILITADEKIRIIQWKIEGDNLQFYSKKENTHYNIITTLSKLGNGLILSGTYDNCVKIW